MSRSTPVRTLGVVILALAIVACAGSDDSATTVTQPPGGSAPEGTQGQSGGSGGGNCPLDVGDLDRITGASWTFQDRETDHPYDLDPSFTSSVACLYAADGITTELGGTMTLRAYLFTGAHAAGFKDYFLDRCDLLEYEVITGSGDTAVCPWKDGSIPEGIAGDANRLLAIYFFNWHGSDELINSSTEELLRAGR